MGPFASHLKRTHGIASNKPARTRRRPKMAAADDGVTNVAVPIRQPSIVAAPIATVEEMEQLRSLAQQEGGGTFYVNIEKHDKGKPVATTSQFMTLTDLERRREFCADFGGGGRYVLRVCSSTDRSKVLKVLIADVEGPSMTIEGKNGVQEKTEQRPAAVSALAQATELERVREDLRRAQEFIAEQKRKHDEDTRDNALRTELRSMREEFRTAAQPQRSAAAEIAAVVAPLVTEFIKSSQAAADRHNQMMMQLLSKDQLGPVMAMMEKQGSQRKELNELVSKFEDQRMEMFKMMQGAKDSAADGYAKMMAAQAAATQATVTSLSTILEQTAKMQGPDEPAWKEPVSRLMDMLGMGLTAVVEKQQQAAAAMPAPQLSGAQQLPKIEAPKQQDPLADQKQRLRDALSGQDSEAAAVALVELMDTMLVQQPTDADVQFFWSNPAEGTRRIVGPYLAQRGGEGQRFLDAMVVAVPRHVAEFEKEDGDDASSGSNGEESA